MRQPIIFHVDVNSAFLSWEAAYRIEILGEALDLRSIPSAIGGDREKRKGIILAKSMAAKPYHIQTGEPVVSALSKCPQLFIAKPDYALYERCSKAFITLLQDYTPVVEQYSIDEAYMNMTGTEGLYGDPLSIAHIIKNRIEKELGFTVNIGISSNKLLAKMASDFQKPNRVHTLFPNEIESKMWPLGIRELFYVGRSTEDKLRKIGIKTIKQLAQTDVKLLKSYLGKQGEVIHAYANGIDLTTLISSKLPNKSYGNSMTIPYDVDSFEHAKKVILSLCETVGTRLRADDARAICMSITLVDMYFEHVSHQKTLQNATNVTQELYQYACTLLDEIWNQKIPIRQLGVHASKVEYGEAYQYHLLDTIKNDKYAKLDKAIDQIRNKYGDDSVMRSTFVNDQLTHMAGGITKEKRTGITKCGP